MRAILPSLRGPLARAPRFRFKYDAITIERRYRLAGNSRRRYVSSFIRNRHKQLPFFSPFKDLSISTSSPVHLGTLQP